MEKPGAQSKIKLADRMALTIIIDIDIRALCLVPSSQGSTIGKEALLETLSLSARKESYP